MLKGTRTVSVSGLQIPILTYGDTELFLVHTLTGRKAPAQPS